MTNRTLTDEIITIIQSVANNNTAPTLATITKIYTDNYIDAKLTNGTYKYIQSIGEPKIDDTVIIAYTEDNTPIAINNTTLTDYYNKTETDTLLNTKQDTLVSGTNIKTINNNSLLGSGNITIEGGGGGDYVTEEELNSILSSYTTITFSNSTYAPLVHTHSQYITREEISDLDINLTTLELVPYSDNQNGVMCFERVQKTIEELDIELTAETMSNGYLKIEANLIEREVDNDTNS